MAGIRFQSRLTQYLDDNGDPLPAGKLLFTVAGTTTLQDTYSDDDLMTENTNPVLLDADGRQVTDIFLDPALAYRVRLYSATDVLIAEDDPVGGNDVSAAIETHNDDLTAHYAASESQRGFVELASQSEVNTGTDTARAVTPATLAGRTATETRAGVVELATNAEVATGTDTARAVTPAGFAAALAGGTLYASAAETLAGVSTKAITPAGFAGNKSLAASGYYKFPGGFILQWGKTASLTGDAKTTITFPTAFSTTNYAVVVTSNQNIPGGGVVMPGAAVDNFTTTTFDLGNDYGSATAYTWIAAGY